MTVRQSVAILASSVLAGDAVSRHIVDIAQSLMRAGYPVQVCYSGVYTREEPDIRAISVRVVPGDPLPQADLYLVEYASWFPLAEHLRSYPARSIFWYHGVTPTEFWESDADRRHQERAVLGIGLAHYADAVVACSPFGAAELSDHERDLTGRVRVIANAVDYQSFSERPSEHDLEDLRTQLGATNRRVLLSVGRLAANKRLDLLVSALARLTARHKDILLLVIGDDRSAPAYVAYAEEIRAQVRELHLEDHVRFLGKVPRVEPYYHLADVLVLTSEHEGFGLPLIEAMAAGVPAVASDAGAMPWVIGADTESPAGLLFERGSEESLARAIDSILTDPRLASELRRIGRERVGRYGLQAFGDATVGLVREVLAMGPILRRPSRPPEQVFSRADVSLREYRVRSRVPLIGPFIAWLRVQLTSHIKEPYLDSIVERQVLYNMSMTKRLLRLEEAISSQAEELARFQEEIERPSRRSVDAAEPPSGAGEA